MIDSGGAQVHGAGIDHDDLNDHVELPRIESWPLQPIIVFVARY